MCRDYSEMINSSHEMNCEYSIRAIVNKRAMTILLLPDVNCIELLDFKVSLYAHVHLVIATYTNINVM